MNTLQQSSSSMLRTKVDLPPTAQNVFPTMTELEVEVTNHMKAAKTQKQQ
jgi:hypothetical protein